MNAQRSLCSDFSHRHISKRRAEEMLAAGVALIVTHRGPAGRMALRWTHDGKEKWDIRGASCKYGPYILTNHPIHVVMREEISA
jgi:hypothetical protein